VILIGFVSFLLSILFFFWDLFKHWLSIFTSPLQEPEMFWILIPIWVNWFFAEFFQEKHGTSFGNAVSNGAIAIIASIDWSRYLYRMLVEGVIMFTFGLFLKFFVAVTVLAFGIYVIIEGSKSREIVFFIGKIRWVTYVLVMFTPIVYLQNSATDIGINWQTIVAMVLFFPLYWWIIEVFDRISPEPKYFKSGQA
jgi:hypothetical protein